MTDTAQYQGPITRTMTQAFADVEPLDKVSNITDYPVSPEDVQKEMEEERQQYQSRIDNEKVMLEQAVELIERFSIPSGEPGRYLYEEIDNDLYEDDSMKCIQAIIFSKETDEETINYTLRGQGLSHFIENFKLPQTPHNSLFSRVSNWVLNGRPDWGFKIEVFTRDCVYFSQGQSVDDPSRTFMSVCLPYILNPLKQTYTFY